MFFLTRKIIIIINSIMDILFFFIKFKKKIIFAGHDKFPFSGNLRMICEEYIKANSYDIYIYQKNINKNLEEYLIKNNVTIMKNFSLISSYHIVTSSKVFLSHSLRNIGIIIKNPKRKIINLWHGVPIKKIELCMNKITTLKYKQIKRNSLLYDMMISSNKLDKLAISSCFNLDYNKVFELGLPRYDIINANYTELPYDLQIMENKIKKLKGNKKLILYAPTFRENKTLDISKFINIIHKINYDNILIGVRLHSYSYSKIDHTIINNNNLINFSHEEFYETNLLLRHVDLLIVDYSSIWIDYLLKDSFLISYIYDIEIYIQNERDFLYDYKKIFPGEITYTEDELIKLIDLFAKNKLPKKNLKNHILLSTYNYKISQKIWQLIEKG